MKFAASINTPILNNELNSNELNNSDLNNNQQIRKEKYFTQIMDISQPLFQKNQQSGLDKLKTIDYKKQKEPDVIII